MFNLRNAFYLLIRNEQDLLNFMKDIERSHYVYLLGGAVRNYVENEYNYSESRLPRDFDFVVEYKKGKTLEQILKKRCIHYKKNRFGGYKIKIGKYKIDIWKLEDTWAFKHSSMITNFANLENSVFLNIDGIVYDFHRDKFYDKVYETATISRKLCVVFKQEPYANINAIRAEIYAERYNMTYSNQVSKIIKKCKEIRIS